MKAEGAGEIVVSGRLGKVKLPETALIRITWRACAPRMEKGKCYAPLTIDIKRYWWRWVMIFPIGILINCIKRSFGIRDGGVDVEWRVLAT